VLAAIGGLLGVLIGIGISQLVAATTPMPVRTSLFIIVLSLGVATSIGLFFGVYPARKAAQFDPVVALQSE
jgi:putative ABC transport system permease protein